jgi:hypothetical protein
MPCGIKLKTAVAGPQPDRGKLVPCSVNSHREIYYVFNKFLRYGIESSAK